MFHKSFLISGVMMLKACVLTSDLVDKLLQSP